jgi:hypothetical protein
MNRVSAHEVPNIGHFPLTPRMLQAAHAFSVLSEVKPVTGAVRRRLDDPKVICARLQNRHRHTMNRRNSRCRTTVRSGRGLPLAGGVAE